MQSSIFLSVLSDLLIAAAAGVLTTAAPCILPMLPILLGVSLVNPSRLRPILIVAGFVTVFCATTLLFSAFTRLLGLSHETLRQIAVVMIALFGLSMIWPALFSSLMQRLNQAIPTENIGNGNGHLGAFFLGGSLGLIWAPCAGPVLASILVLVATSPSLAQSGGMLLAYTVGAAVPMLLIAYGGQFAAQKVRMLAKHGRTLQRGTGICVVLVSVAIFLKYDAFLISKLAFLYPEGRLGL